MNRIRETDIKDKRGNLVISPGLKVRHRKSQYEYTIDSIVKDSSGLITVMLKKPDAPRFDSTAQKAEVLKDKPAAESKPQKTQPQPQAQSQQQNKMVYEAEQIEDFSTSYYTPEDEADDDLIAVPANEFEKEYEVR